jgi:tripartite-type tricarboxylate transporter receptor subunit TctC
LSVAPSPAYSSRYFRLFLRYSRWQLPTTGRARRRAIRTSPCASCCHSRPGGVADTTARIIAEKLGDKLGQRFYVENQAGAGGIAAARTVISSAPDGYTLALLSNGTAVSVSLFKKLPFDPLRDFEPISSLGFFDFVFATGANSEFKTLTDFIAAAQNKPGALNVGTINIGSTQNLSAELFKTSAGIDFTIIPHQHPRSRSRCCRATLR